jgi:hypothetical protein
MKSEHSVIGPGDISPEEIRAATTLAAQQALVRKKIAEKAVADIAAMRSIRLGSFHLETDASARKKVRNAEKAMRRARR